MPVTISALITTRDRPRLLADALASVARQTRAPLETRIADDGDLPLDPGAVGEGLLDLRVLRSDARNAAGARNLVAREARGDVLAFLDDDDLWLAGHLAHDWDEDLMRHDDFIAPSALAVRRTLFERLGGFDPSFRYSEDWDFLLRAARLSRPRRVPGITAQVRLRDDNASANRGPERRECLDRLSARHGLPALTIKTFWEVAEAVADSAGGAPASDSAARARARSRS